MIPPPRLRAADLLAVGTVRLRSRRLRAGLSALGVSIGIAALVGVLGITRSSQSDLLAQLDQLGTNLLTVVNGRDLAGAEAELPVPAAGMISRVDGVQQVSATAQLDTAHVFRTDRIPPVQTAGLSVRVCDARLVTTLDGALHAGAFLTAATQRYPVTVLGWQAASTLGITATGGRVWISGHWFVVAGILRSLPLAPEIDRSALIGLPVGARLFGWDGHPSRIYVRADTDRTAEVANLLARAANPENPSQVDASRPSDALSARLAAAESGTGLFLGLGAVALLVGGIGIANVMVVGVLERRTEIGLRRALGAARRHVAVQFVTESVLLAAAGGLLGVALGSGLTVAVARARGWAVLIPPTVVLGGLAAALAIGSVAGLYPALRAARMAPVDALRSG